MLRSSLLAAAALLTVAVPAFANEGTGTTTQSVTGGTPSRAHAWPDAVAVLGPDGSCTGTLIAPDVVLTAGHCVEAHPTRVIADTTDYNASGGKSVAIKSMTAYPNWAGSYDVAVIVLEAPIVGVEPRAVGTSCTFEGFHDQMDIHLVGFGSTDAQGVATNSQLREASAPVVDADCSNGHGCVKAVAPGGEFVAGGDGKDSCFGDSGGPVYLDTPRGTMLVGAVSRGVDGSATPCGGGGIYVRTDKIVRWVEQTTGRTIAKDSCAAGTEEPGATNPDGTAEGEGNLRDATASTGGCSAGGQGSGAGALVVVALGLAALRRRRTV